MHDAWGFSLLYLQLSETTTKLQKISRQTPYITQLRFSILGKRVDTLQDALEVLVGWHTEGCGRVWHTYATYDAFRVDSSIFDIAVFKPPPVDRNNKLLLKYIQNKSQTVNPNRKYGHFRYVSTVLYIFHLPHGSRAWSSSVQLRETRASWPHCSPY
jgi:hypothetical protein